MGRQTGKGGADLSIEAVHKNVRYLVTSDVTDVEKIGEHWQEYVKAEK